MSFSPNINVWTLGKGTRGAWKLQHTTESMEDAAAVFLKLQGEGKQVALYELGLFEHEGKQVAGQVAFWWSPNLNEAMEREPEDRGIGWSDGFDTWVEYTFPQVAETALPAIWKESVPAAVLQPTERYVEASCDQCGLIVPMNQLQRFTHEVRSGRSSGASHTSGSTSRQSQGGSLSNSSKSRSFSQSNRIYYKTETLIL